MASEISSIKTSNGQLYPLKDLSARADLSVIKAVTGLLLCDGNGNIQSGGTLTAVVSPAARQRITVTGSSGQISGTSLSFDGSTVNQYLSKKGAWQEISASAVFVKDPSVPAYASGVMSDISVIKLDSEEYARLLAQGQTQPNAIYIVSGDYVNAYGQQLKNLAYPTDLSDATTKEYVDSAVSNSLSDYYLKSETSSAAEISSALEQKSSVMFVEWED